MFDVDTKISDKHIDTMINNITNYRGSVSLPDYKAITVLFIGTHKSRWYLNKIKYHLDAFYLCVWVVYWQLLIEKARWKSENHTVMESPTSHTLGSYAVVGLPPRLPYLSSI